jgi:hypothetical protein
VFHAAAWIRVRWVDVAYRFARPALFRVVWFQDAEFCFIGFGVNVCPQRCGSAKNIRYALKTPYPWVFSAYAPRR